jgi:hypothetical protein
VIKQTKIIEYAVKDAQIVVKISIAMEVLNKGKNNDFVKAAKQKIRLPLTLSSIGRSYVANEGLKTFDGHLPCQNFDEYLMGNVTDI